MKNELKPKLCPYCDFGYGHKGMDICGKCQGIGSVFVVDGNIFPNTKEGYESALVLWLYKKPKKKS